jgi:hypothetical protein
MPWTMWQALARYLGSNATVSPGESGETVFIAEASDWDSIGFTSKLFLEGLKAVSFLALDEAVYVSGTEFFVDAGVAKSDTSRADVAGAKRLLLLAPLVTCCHRIHLPQQRNRCGASLWFQIEIQQSSGIGSVGPLTAHLAGLAERVLAKPVKHSVLRGERI